jgi:hypothetical protein
LGSARFASDLASGSPGSMPASAAARGDSPPPTSPGPLASGSSAARSSPRTPPSATRASPGSSVSSPT